MPITQQQSDEYWTRGYVGGSLAAVVMDRNRRMTRRDAYEIMTGHVLPPEFPEDRRIFGQVAEAGVIAYLRTQYDRCSENVEWLDAENDLGGHIDLVILKGRIPVEIKGVSSWLSAEWGAEQTDEIPLEPYWQIQHALHGVSVRYKIEHTPPPQYGLAVALVGGTLKRYRIERDERGIE